LADWRTLRHRVVVLKQLGKLLIEVVLLFGPIDRVVGALISILMRFAGRSGRVSA
jgi:hypothetical protein